MVLTLAVTASVAWDMVGHKHAVADFDVFDFATDFTYDACGFVSQHARRFRNTIPFQDVAAADTARHHLEERFIFIDAWKGDFFDADVMVVVVEGGKQKVHQKERGSGFSCDYLFVEVVSFLGIVAFVDYGADGFD